MRVQVSRPGKQERAPRQGSLPPSYLSFWGKARPSDDASNSWHPVAYHLLDVAASAQAILDVRPFALERIARLLALEPEAARELVVTLAALHDIGKFAPAFQAKSPEHWPPVLGALDPARISSTHHTADGYALWCQVLAPTLADRLWSGAKRALDVLAPAVFGHHGRPVSTADGRPPIGSVFGEIATREARACAEDIIALLLPEPITDRTPDDAGVRVASWLVSGLMTVADWIGSNDESFPYRAPTEELAAYWDRASECARRAIRRAGITPPPAAPPRSFQELTGRESATPLQHWAMTVSLPAGPVLIVLEDVTGAGKTEAAQILVHRLMTDRRAAGAYWAMPTAATANAMYLRQAEAVQALFAPGDGDLKPSLVLAHGQAHFHDAFRATVWRDPDDRRARPGIDEMQQELTADAACAAFLADDRRAALLADVGAGTVDQALLAALPSRFNTVRLFGLAEKVLVFDEAHAYDAYMGIEAQQLLRFQAALGGSAIVLSATLSRKQREEFVTAWVEGLQQGRRRVAPLFAGSLPPLIQSSDYPLATIISQGDDGVREVHVDTIPWSARVVPVRLVHAERDVLEHVIASARRGAATAWVRNTVDECIATAAQLRAEGLSPIVFHARFAQGDRQNREAQVLELFGPRGESARRRGAVLVATQVVEQSLDLDFDVLVSDLAPVDLLIQRAGRLWRHRDRNAERPDGLPLELVVLSPPPDDDPDKDWLTRVLPKTGRVYDDVGVLWRTVRVLRDAGAIVTPGGLRDLVESVYGSAEVPDALKTRADEAEGKRYGAAAAAQHATLHLSDGYHGDLKGWVDDLRPMTRLGEDQSTVRLARVRSDGSLEPWESRAGSPRKAWALSEVRVSAARVPFGSMPPAAHWDAADAVRAEWGRFEQEITVLPLRAVPGRSGVWQGELVRPDGQAVQLCYSREEGLVFGACDG